MTWSNFIIGLWIFLAIAIPAFIGLLLWNTRSSKGVVARLRKAGL
ncbi:MAG: hypothetical protein Q7N50_15885 [Armatimonadota bacterium]|nr:hypothetical protein [Armatimonadota bacterium]